MNHDESIDVLLLNSFEASAFFKRLIWVIDVPRSGDAEPKDATPSPSKLRQRWGQENQAPWRGENAEILGLAWSESILLWQKFGESSPCFFWMTSRVWGAETGDVQSQPGSGFSDRFYCAPAKKVKITFVGQSRGDASLRRSVSGVDVPSITRLTWTANEEISPETRAFKAIPKPLETQDDPNWRLFSAVEITTSN